MTSLSNVLNYAARGWQVFPLKPQLKEPATARGFYDATNNPATLRRWFEKFPYNIGVRTGTASGVFVVDIDGDQGAASLRMLEAQHGALPATLISTTGKGAHYWFIADGPIPCSTGKLAAGIDVHRRRRLCRRAAVRSSERENFISGLTIRSTSTGADWLCALPAPPSRCRFPNARRSLIRRPLMASPVPMATRRLMPR